MQTALLEMIVGLRMEEGLSLRDAKIMAQWEIGRSYTDIARSIRGVKKGVVAGVVRKHRTDGYDKPRGPLSQPRSKHNSFRTTPTVHEIRQMKRKPRWLLHRRGMSTRDLLVNALHGDTNVYHR